MIRLAVALLPLLVLATPPASAEPPQRAPSAGVQLASGGNGAHLPAGTIIVTQSDGQLRAHDIVRAAVMSGSGKEAKSIGQIEDLLFDDSGRLVAALVGVGGFLGIGEKTVALSWDALKRDRERGNIVAFVTPLSRQQLEQAPAFVSAAQRKASEQKREVLEKMKQLSPASDLAPPAITD